MMERVLQSGRVYDWSRRLIGADREAARFASRLVEPHDGMRILDIGCGNGRLVPHLRGAGCLGIDANESYIDDARRRHSHHGVEFRCTPAEGFDQFAPASFDVVTCLGVLHHLDDDQCDAVVDLARKALRPSGTFVSLDPCLDPHQPTTARLLVALDRGRFVRNQSDYRRRLEPGLTIERTEIWSDIYRFPYTQLAMVASVPG